MAANTPVDIVLSSEPAMDAVCYVVDLFPCEAPLPRDIATLSLRQSDLMFSCQTERTLRAMAALDGFRARDRPRIDVVRTSYAAVDEPAMKGWDFSETAIRRRWQAGYSDMGAAVARFRASPPGSPGLRVHPIVRA
jgi:hypothetical protein